MDLNFTNISGLAFTGFSLYKAAEMTEDIARFALKTPRGQNTFIKALPPQLKLAFTAISLPLVLRSTTQAISNCVSGNPITENDLHAATSGLITGSSLILGACMTAGYTSPALVTVTLALSALSLAVDLADVAYGFATHEDNQQNLINLIAIIVFNFGREERALYTQKNSAAFGRNYNSFSRYQTRELAPECGIDRNLFSSNGFGMALAGGSTDENFGQANPRVYGKRTSDATVDDLIPSTVFFKNTDPTAAGGSPAFRPLITPEQLEKRIGEFTPDKLRVDWQSGPPYRIASDEVDVARTEQISRDHLKVNNNSGLTKKQLRDPKTAVLWSLAPRDDYVQIISRRELGLDGPDLVMDGYGFTGALCFTNPIEDQYFATSQSYALAYLEAAISPKRGINFLEPHTFAQYQQAVDSTIARAKENNAPAVVCLSGIGYNTRTLLKMNLYARQKAAEAGVAIEVGLGNYAAAGPYRILDEAFDWHYWGNAEEFMHNKFVGGLMPTPRHPPLARVVADMDWIFAGSGDTVVHRKFQTLHLTLKRGCARPCAHCAEKDFSGGIQPASNISELKALIDEAVAKRIKHVYFWDPNFGLSWKNDTDPEAEIIRYIHENGMTFSLLTEVGVIKKWGQFMTDNGLVKVFLGIESLSPAHESSGNLRAALNRPQQKLSETEATVKWLEEKKVETVGLYMLGNPGETPDQIRAGVSRLAALVPTSQISTTTPFPGTNLFRQGVKNGWIHSFDPEEMFYGRGSWAPDGVRQDPLELRRTWLWAHETVNNVRRPGGLLDFQRRMMARRN